MQDLANRNSEAKLMLCFGTCSAMKSYLGGASAMKLTSLGEIIAERKFVMRTDSGTQREVLEFTREPATVL
jgi:hypothetical protein